MSNMNRLDTARRALVVKVLCEGNGLRATSRITGVARMTVEKLLRDLGAACAAYQNTAYRNLKTQRVQCDEIWSFCYAKAGHVTPEIKEKHADAGDVWTWTAIDADSKLVFSWLVGDRNRANAIAFMRDVESRLANRVQLSTDQLSAYLPAVDIAFSGNVDYGQIQKYFKGGESGRYSPSICIGCTKFEVTGSPDRDHINTSYVERNNLTMRMQMRRFTRLTNAFSKKVQMHAHSVALHFMFYNFVQIHSTLRQTPAMAAGITDRVWDAEDIIALLG